jgi:hypothetical protein
LRSTDPVSIDVISIDDVSIAHMVTFCVRGMEGVR